MSEIKKRATKGFAWSLISQFSLQIVQTATTIVLARLLLPSDFGLLGMVAVFTGLISILNQFGLTTAIVQRKDLKIGHLNTAFWASNAVGLIIFGVSAGISPLVADFYNQAIIKPIMIVLSLNFIFDSITSVHQAVLTRRLEFKKLAIIAVASAIVSGIISITMAFKGFGVWSIVVGSTVASIVQIIIYPFYFRWFPKLSFSMQRFKEIFGFGSVYTANAISNYVNGNLDYFFIGKFLGAAPLGFYSLAYRLIMFPQRKLGAALNRVAFPTYSKFQGDNERLARGYLSAVAYLNFVTFPFLVGLALVAPEFVKVIYGEKWIPAIVPLELLCIAGIMIQLAANTGSVVMAKGRVDIPLKLSIIRAVLLAIVLFFFARRGLIVVSVIVDIFFFLYNSIFIVVANKLIGLNLINYLKRIAPVFVSSLAMAGGVFGLRFALKGLHSLVLSLIFMVIVGMIIYLVSFWLQDKKTVLEIWDLLKALKPKRAQNNV